MATPTTTTTPTATGQATVVTVTVGASQTADSGGDDTVSSTMSLIYIYSAATTEAQPTASSSSSDSHHLAGGAIAGIVVGCVAFLVLLALGLFCYSRKIARKRRRQRAPSTLHFPPSATPQTLPSRAESRAPTGLHTLAMHSPAMHSPAMNSPAMHSPSMQQQMALLRSDRGGNDSRGASRTQQYTIATPSPRTPRSNNRHYPKTPPQGMIPELEGSRGHQQPKVHEVYGSYVHPVELQAGSTTNLVAVAEVAEIKKARATEKIVTTSITTMPSSRDKDYSDSASTGYLSPTWPPPPESRGGIGSGGGDTNTVSDMDRTDASTIATDYGKSLQSIHVYFSPGSEYGGLGIGSSPTSANFPPELARRQSQIQIALAMSQAASVSSTGSKSRPRGSTMGSSIGNTNWGPNR